MNIKNLDLEKSIGLALVIFLCIFPIFFGYFHVGLMGKFATFILLAIALDLVWGYIGLLSMGHGVFFGLGGYILALSYSFQNGVPGFMSRFNITEIPFLMKPLTNIPISIVLGILIPGLIAALIGSFIFKGGVSGVYFAIITLAMAVIFQMLIITMQAYTGGSNGLMGLPMFPIFGDPLTLHQFYYVVLALVILTYLFSRWLTRSHFGKVMRAISENESRVSFFSYNPDNYKIFIYTISAMLSGLAGMLYVSMNGFISPTDVGISFSTMLVLWVAIGGRGTLMGAVIGVLFINWTSNALSESYPDIWMLFVGLLMVIVVIFLPDGIYGTLLKKWENKRNNTKNEDEIEVSIRKKVV